MVERAMSLEACKTIFETDVKRLIHSHVMLETASMLAVALGTAGMVTGGIVPDKGVLDFVLLCCVTTPFLVGGASTGPIVLIDHARKIPVVTGLREIFTLRDESFDPYVQLYTHLLHLEAPERPRYKSDIIDLLVNYHTMTENIKAALSKKSYHSRQNSWMALDDDVFAFRENLGRVTTDACYLSRLYKGLKSPSEVQPRLAMEAEHVLALITTEHLDPQVQPHLNFLQCLADGAIVGDGYSLRTHSARVAPMVYR